MSVIGTLRYDSIADPTLGEIDNRSVSIDAFGAHVAVDVRLDGRGEIRVSRLSAAAGGLRSFGNPESVVFTVLGSFDVLRSYLETLERSKPDVPTELDTGILSVGGGRPSQLVEFGIGEPNFVLDVVVRPDTL